MKLISAGCSSKTIHGEDHCEMLLMCAMDGSFSKPVRLALANANSGKRAECELDAQDVIALRNHIIAIRDSGWKSAGRDLLRLTGEDSAYLECYRDNMGEPFRAGMSFFLEDPASGDYVGLFVEQREVLSLLDALFGLKADSTDSAAGA